ncbi:family 43 glycosylhydrolase [Enterococcus casseliflavus]|uniref:family 43 glycosylhydrolase n=1 Tax=Enterococcus casseliflavus TaxID=37734 RepID=UPI001C44A1FD|nr:family 43 glycosylhydrolase [Enterococcus casseliflavus]MBV6375500.1 family 43 glycosylhydrolase [Enterococcus casseliflavus]
MRKQTFNPYLPSYEYVPDGEPRVFNDTLYIFGSHDKFGGNDYCINDYVCWSAPVDDLSKWTLSGTIFKKEQCPHKGNLFAPDVVQGFDGKFYLYFSAAESSVISVAICDTPDGQYEYLGDVSYSDGTRLGERSTDNFQFDPSVLIDGTRVWLYSGSGQTSIQSRIKNKIAGAMSIELMNDMITIKTDPKLIMTADETWKSPNFFEAASVRKIKSLYYLVFSATNGSGLNYCTSEYPDKDFKYRGVIHSPSDIGYNKRNHLSATYPIGNTHGGLVEINNHWYIFNHRMTNKNYYTRQGVAEQIFINDDGTINQVESTSCGLNNGPLVGDGLYPSYIACNLMSKNIIGIPSINKGPYITQTGDDRNEGPNQFVTNITNNDLIGFKYFDFKNKISQISVKIKGDGSGKFLIFTDEKCRNKICEINIKPSSNWETYASNATSCSGIQPLYFKYKGNKSISFDEFHLITN